jgi:hypothetical protein
VKCPNCQGTGMIYVGGEEYPHSICRGTGVLPEPTELEMRADIVFGAQPKASQESWEEFLPKSPEPTVPSPDSAADRARDVIAEAVGQAVYEWDNERPDAITVEIHITKSILAALDRAGLEVRAKEDGT